MATMVTRTRLNATSYVHCPPPLFLYSISKILPSVEIQTFVKETCINVNYLSLHVVLFAYQDSTEYLELTL